MRTNSASIEVDVPVEVAYGRWAMLPGFPAFMDDVDSVTRLGEGHYCWVTRIAGVRREFESRVDAQGPGEIVWTSVHGLPQEGSVTFEPVGLGRTVITARLDLNPGTVLEKAADRLGLVRRRLRSSLLEFKRHVEAPPSGRVDSSWNVAR